MVANEEVMSSVAFVPTLHVIDRMTLCIGSSAGLQSIVRPAIYITIAIISSWSTEYENDIAPFVVT